MGATDRIFHRRRSAVHQGTPRCDSITAKVHLFLPSRQTAVSTPSRRSRPNHYTRDASRDITLGCQDHHLAVIAPRLPPSDPPPIGRGARLHVAAAPTKCRRWLSDTDGPLIGAVDRNSGLTRRRRSPICWTSFRSGGTICPPASQTARRQKRSMPCWNCAIMSKRSRRSSHKAASDVTDGTHRGRYRTRSGGANSACHFLGRPHKGCRHSFATEPKRGS